VGVFVRVGVMVGVSVGVSSCASTGPAGELHIAGGTIALTAIAKNKVNAATAAAREIALMCFSPH
jgi:hypothetical protein